MKLKLLNVLRFKKQNAREWRWEQIPAGLEFHLGVSDFFGILRILRSWLCLNKEQKAMHSGLFPL